MEFQIPNQEELLLIFAARGGSGCSGTLRQHTTQSGREPLLHANSESGDKMNAEQEFAGGMWKLLALSKFPEGTKCFCGRRAKWIYHTADTVTGSGLNLGEYCLLKRFPGMRGDARTLKHYYKAGICSGCGSAAVQRETLCSECFERADLASCPACGLGRVTPSHEECIDCWRKEQLALSERVCPVCGDKIPTNKPWWTSCYACFLKDKSRGPTAKNITEPVSTRAKAKGPAAKEAARAALRKPSEAAPRISKRGAAKKRKSEGKTSSS